MQPTDPGVSRGPAQRWNELDEVPADFGPAVVTIGNFDGVHRGHHAVLGTVAELARRKGLPSVAITFDPHPLAVLYPDRAPEPLTTIEHRRELLGAIGIDAVLVMAFTREVAQMSPREFVEDVLVGGLHAQEVVVGGDTRFGYRNAGDVNTLRELGAELGFAVHVVSDLGREGQERRWSSTWVRELVAAGDVAGAADVLGRPHRVTGEVVHGDHRGRELGYPTANLSPAAVGAVPADGVYAGWLIVTGSPAADPAAARAVAPGGAPGILEAAGTELGAGAEPGTGGEPERPGAGQRWPAAISIGTNPTFGGTGRRVEAYVLDQQGLDLYGLTVACEFVQRLRPTLTFGGIEDLVRQMALDVAQCRDILGVPAPA